ncbi:bifunctional DNA primase/polymerase [Nonomuraea sp. NPDC001831]|uniref:bifunctional DNA primase/polymerase n=1 Tax=Nonomuraea sp. NPDC001831 TaxID=3364340 RepID=UPI00369A4AE1
MTAPGQLRYALAAATRGWHVFPLAVGDKPPIKGFTDWEAHATTDPGLIRRWWARHPYNIGIACGPSGLLVVDLDKPKPGMEGLRPPSPWDLPGVTEGADVLALLCERAGQPLPFETFTVRTRRGGTHLYYTAPETPALGSTKGKLGWLIDTRAHGGYVLGPGSYVDLPDGTGHYEVIHNTSPAPLPPLLVQPLVPKVHPQQPPVPIPAPQGRRSTYLNAALQGEADRIAAAPPGQRNHTLWVAAVALGQLVAGGALTEAEVTTLLYQQGAAVGQTHREITYTIAAGLKAGAKRPRTVAA